MKTPRSEGSKNDLNKEKNKYNEIMPINKIALVVVGLLILGSVVNVGHIYLVKFSFENRDVETQILKKEMAPIPFAILSANKGVELGEMEVNIQIKNEKGEPVFEEMYTIDKKAKSLVINIPFYFFKLPIYDGYSLDMSIPDKSFTREIHLD